MDVAFREDPNESRFSAANSPPPSAALLENFNEIAHVKRQAMIHVPGPVVDRC